MKRHNMANIKTCSTLALLLLLPFAASRAQESGVFLKLPISARGAGMGDAFTALAGEPLGIYYNPAGIAFLEQPEISLTHHIHLQDISGDSVGLALPVGNFAIGVAPTQFKMKEETLYDSSGNDTGQKFGYQSMIAPVALARRFGPLALGVAAKLYSEKIDSQSSQTTAFDAGAIYALDKLRFGFSSQNYGGKIFDFPVSKIQRVGAAYAGEKFTVAADLVKEGTIENYFNAGGEYSVLEQIKFRAGWRMRKDFGGPTFGLGFNLGSFNLDYAFVRYGELGDTHKMGVSYQFGSGRAVSRETMPVTNKAPMLLWTGEENYTSVGLSTAPGNTATNFVYRVKYADPDNDAPGKGYPKVHIRKGIVEVPGSPFTMEYISGENISGAVYSYSQTLPAGNDYSYSFEAKDARGAEASGEPMSPVAGPVVAQVETPKMTSGINVAVAEFTGKNVSQADASIVADFLRTGLVATGLFNVMDRDNMDSVLSEQKFQNSGCTEQQCAVEMGKLLNVKQMLVGSLSKLLDTYYITVNVIDVETGKIMASYDGDAGNARELKDACQKIVKKISGK